MRFATLTCCLLCIASMALPMSARAQESATPATTERARVAVKIAGEPQDVMAATAVLNERITNANADASIQKVSKVERTEVLAPIAEPTGELARVWIDLGEDPLVVYVVDGAGKRVLVRQVPRGANPEIAREEIGHIVEVALGALRAGEHIGVEREELARETPVPAASPPPIANAPPPTEVPPAPPPPPKTRWQIVPGIYYGARALGDGPELSSGPGLALGFSHRGPRVGLGVKLAGEYRFPSTVDATAARVRFESFAFFFLPTAELALDHARRSILSIGVGPGLELVDAEARDAESASATLADEQTRRDALFRGLVSYGLATPYFRVFAGVGVDVPMRNPRYVLLVRNEPVVLFSPWAARPVFVLGIETN